MRWTAHRSGMRPFSAAKNLAPQSTQLPTRDDSSGFLGTSTAAERFARCSSQRFGGRPRLPFLCRKDAPQSTHLRVLVSSALIGICTASTQNSAPPASTHQVRGVQNPWGQSSRYRRSNVHTSTSNARGGDACGHEASSEGLCSGLRQGVFPRRKMSSCASITHGFREKKSEHKPECPPLGQETVSVA